MTMCNVILALVALLALASPAFAQTQIGPAGIKPPPFNLLAYGGKGDGSTDNYPAWLKATTAACATGHGGRLYLPAGSYKFSTVPTITCSDVGVEGDGSELTTILTTSATADVLQITGTSGSILQHNFVRHLSLGRTVAPGIGSGSAGLNLTWTNWANIEDVFSYNSVTQFYSNNSTGAIYSRTHAFRTFAYQGSGDTYTGYGLTTSTTTGNQSNTYLNAWSVADGNDGVLFGGIGYGFKFNGTSLHDIYCINCEADNTTYGFYVDGSSTSATLNWNLQFNGSHADTYGTAGFYITGLTGSGQLTINGGWTNTGVTGAANAGVYITGSQGVTVTGLQNFGGGNTGYTQCLYATNASNITYVGNICKYAAYGLYLDNTGGNVNASTFSSNVFYTDSSTHLMTAAAYVKAAGRVTISNNVINGGAAGSITNGFVGVSTPGFVSISGNQFNTGAITTASVTGFTGATNFISSNGGYNPVGDLTGSVSFSTGAAWTNQLGVTVVVTVSGGTVTQIALNGVNTGLTSGAFTIPPGGTFTPTYSGSPTFKVQGL